MVFGIPNRDVSFGCQYSLSPRTEDPVTFTLKKGSRLQLASRIVSFKVSSYDGVVHYGESIVFDRNYKGRLALSRNQNVDFVLKKVGQRLQYASVWDVYLLIYSSFVKATLESIGAWFRSATISSMGLTQRRSR